MLLYFRRYPLYVFIAVQIVLFLFYYTSKNSSCFFSALTPKADYEWISSQKYILGEDGRRQYSYDHNMPLIFIGGMPRSGTTLLRVLLDAHPDIRCGEETRVIPRLLSYRMSWMKAPFESKRLEEAGITAEVLDSAIGSFILEIIVRHGKPAPRLCNKDPFTLRSAVYLQYLFPNAKFIFMIRDGRAVVHSIISRQVTISGFDLSSYRQCLKKWNSAMSSMYTQCSKLGPSVCLPVYYEQLVLHPKQWMQKILNFLDVSWNETVLHHEKHIDNGDISLSKLERSTDQVIKPINIEALSKWVGHIPADVVEEMDQVAPMLRKLGYDPSGTPNYGEPDSFVMENMHELNRNRDNWINKEEQMKEQRSKLRERIMTSSAQKKKSSEPPASSDSSI